MFFQVRPTNNSPQNKANLIAKESSKNNYGYKNYDICVAAGSGNKSGSKKDWISRNEKGEQDSGLNKNDGPN